VVTKVSFSLRNQNKPKILVGLSGGVDSAVCARLLKEEYTVIGCYLSIGPEGSAGEADARRVARQLELPLQVVDISRELEEQVKAPFAAGYLAGRTPLPCARCNPLVKFPALLRASQATGAALVATGHYARTRREGGRTLLLQGRSANDQSYLLARLSQEILQKIIFPLGDYSKEEVRALAGRYGLPVAEKPDSMEICFIPDHDYAAWLARRGTVPPEGDFVSPEGAVLGRHRGIHHYTLGQGRGLGISGKSRYYVSRLDPERNTVTLSDGSDLDRRTIFCERPNWIAIEAPEGPVEALVRFRHGRQGTPCTLLVQGRSVRIEAHGPVRAPTPGQLAVFYTGETVLGSAWIEGYA